MFNYPGYRNYKKSLLEFYVCYKLFKFVSGFSEISLHQLTILNTDEL